MNLKKLNLLYLVTFFFFSTVINSQATMITNQNFFDINDTLIDFETHPVTGNSLGHTSYLSNQYETLGVLFSSEDSPNSYQNTDKGDANGRFESPFRVLSSISGGGAPTSGSRYASGVYFNGWGTSDMRIDFLQGASSFGMYIIDNDFTTVRLQAFDRTGALLESITVPQSSEGGAAYYGIDVSGTGNFISYFILDGFNGSDLDSTFIDDLSFRAVSIPNTIWLLGIGFISLAGWRKTQHFSLVKQS